MGTRGGRHPELLLAGATVLAVAAALAGAEFLLRLADPSYLGREQGATVYSERYGWAYRRGYRGPVHGVWTRINARGYRGGEHSRERPPGRVRLVLLGDSILFGTGVEEEATFASLLSRRTGRYEALNLGVEGYGTDQELLVLEDEGLGYRPDVVVLNFCLGNDATNNGLAADEFYPSLPKPYFTVEGDGLRLHDEHLRLTPWRRVAQGLRDHSHLLARLGRALPLRASEPRGPAHRLSRREANQLSLRLVRRIGERALAKGARFLVVAHPNRPEMLRPSPLSRALRSALDRAGIPLLHLRERYAARGLGPDDVLLDFQGHLSPAGHRVVVEELETWLASLESRGPAAGS